MTEYVTIQDYLLTGDLERGKEFVVGYVRADIDDPIGYARDTVAGRWRGWSGTGSPARELHIGGYRRLRETADWVEA